MGTVLTGPWTDSQVYSVDEVLDLTGEHWLDLVQVYNSFVDTYKIFTDSKTVWPDQCDIAIKSLKLITEPIQEFSRFLDSSVQLPFDVCILRYPLAKLLHRMKAQLDELRLLIATFGSNKAPSQQTFMLLQDIQQKLEMLFQNWKEAQWHVKQFLDQTQMLRDSAYFVES